MQRRFFIIPLAVIAGLVFFVEALFFLVPARLVEEVVKKEVHEQSGLVMSARSFRRVFPLGYEATGVRLKNTKWSEGLYLTRVRARFSPLGLLSLRAAVVLSGDIYGGVLRGRLSRGIATDYARIDIKQAVLPPLAALKGLEPGLAHIQLDITTKRDQGCPEGSIKAKAVEGRLKAFSIMGLKIPEGKLSEEGLDIRLAKCKVYVKSAWIKGHAFSVRASGVFGLTSPPANAPMDMRIELSPRGKLMEDLDKLIFLRPYRRSSGYYRVVVRGTPSAPVIRAQ